MAPAVAAWAGATADVVEAFVDLEGGVDGLLAVQTMGLDVSDVLDRALAEAADDA